MGLLDNTSEDPRSRGRRYGIMIGAGVLLLALSFYLLWFTFLHVPERRAAARFMDAIAAGNNELAYKMMKADAGAYPYKDFLGDWGPGGYYGPVKSYKIESATSPPKGGSGVIIVVELSPFQPFPDANDVEKARATREVRLWVEKRDKSITFAPPPI
jgi:hypothetical protein